MNLKHNKGKKVSLDGMRKGKRVCVEGRQVLQRHWEGNENINRCEATKSQSPPRISVCAEGHGKSVM